MVVKRAWQIQWMYAESVVALSDASIEEIVFVRVKCKKSLIWEDWF